MVKEKIIRFILKNKSQFEQKLFMFIKYIKLNYLFYKREGLKLLPDLYRKSVIKVKGLIVMKMKYFRKNEFADLIVVRFLKKKFKNKFYKKEAHYARNIEKNGNNYLIKVNTFFSYYIGNILNAVDAIKTTEFSVSLNKWYVSIVRLQKTDDLKKFYRKNFSPKIYSFIFYCKKLLFVLFKYWPIKLSIKIKFIQVYYIHFTVKILSVRFLKLSFFQFVRLFNSLVLLNWNKVSGKSLNFDKFYQNLTFRDLVRFFDITAIKIKLLKTYYFVVNFFYFRKILIENNFLVARVRKIKILSLKNIFISMKLNEIWLRIRYGLDSAGAWTGLYTNYNNLIQTARRRNAKELTIRIKRSRVRRQQFVFKRLRESVWPFFGFKRMHYQNFSKSKKLNFSKFLKKRGINNSNKIQFLKYFLKHNRAKKGKFLNRRVLKKINLLYKRIININRQKMQRKPIFSNFSISPSAESIVDFKHFNRLEHMTSFFSAPIFADYKAIHRFKFSYIRKRILKDFVVSTKMNVNNKVVMPFQKYGFTNHVHSNSPIRAQFNFKLYRGYSINFIESATLNNIYSVNLNHLNVIKGVEDSLVNTDDNFRANIWIMRLRFSYIGGLNIFYHIRVPTTPYLDASDKFFFDQYKFETRGVSAALSSYKSLFNLNSKVFISGYKKKFIFSESIKDYQTFFSIKSQNNYFHYAQKYYDHLTRFFNSKIHLKLRGLRPDIYYLLNNKSINLISKYKLKKELVYYLNYQKKVDRTTTWDEYIYGQNFFPINNSLNSKYLFVFSDFKFFRFISQWPYKTIQRIMFSYKMHEFDWLKGDFRREYRHMVRIKFDLFNQMTINDWIEINSSIFGSVGHYYQDPPVQEFEEDNDDDDDEDDTDDYEEEGDENLDIELFPTFFKHDFFTFIFNIYIGFTKEVMQQEKTRGALLIPQPVVSLFHQLKRIMDNYEMRMIGPYDDDFFGDWDPYGEIKEYYAEAELEKVEEYINLFFLGPALIIWLTKIMPINVIKDYIFNHYLVFYRNGVLSRIEFFLLTQKNKNRSIIIPVILILFIFWLVYLFSYKFYFSSSAQLFPTPPIALLIVALPFLPLSFIIRNIYWSDKMEFDEGEPELITAKFTLSFYFAVIGFLFLAPFSGMLFGAWPFNNKNFKLINVYDEFTMFMMPLTMFDVANSVPKIYFKPYNERIKWFRYFWSDNSVFELDNHGYKKTIFDSVVESSIKTFEIYKNYNFFLNLATGKQSWFQDSFYFSRMTKFKDTNFFNKLVLFDKLYPKHFYKMQLTFVDLLLKNIPQHNYFRIQYLNIADCSKTKILLFHDYNKIFVKGGETNEFFNSSYQFNEKIFLFSDFKKYNSLLMLKNIQVPSAILDHILVYKINKNNKLLGYQFKPQLSFVQKDFTNYRREHNRVGLYFYNILGEKDFSRYRQGRKMAFDQLDRNIGFKVFNSWFNGRDEITRFQLEALDGLSKNKLALNGVPGLNNKFLNSYNILTKNIFIQNLNINSNLLNFGLNVHMGRYRFKNFYERKIKLFRKLFIKTDIKIRSITSIKDFFLDFGLENKSPLKELVTSYKKAGVLNRYVTSKITNDYGDKPGLFSSIKDLGDKRLIHRGGMPNRKTEKRVLWKHMKFNRGDEFTNIELAPFTTRKWRIFKKIKAEYKYYHYLNEFPRVDFQHRKPTATAQGDFFWDGFINFNSNGPQKLRTKIDGIKLNSVDSMLQSYGLNNEHLIKFSLKWINFIERWNTFKFKFLVALFPNSSYFSKVDQANEFNKINYKLRLSNHLFDTEKNPFTNLSQSNIYYIPGRKRLENFKSIQTDFNDTALIVPFGNRVYKGEFQFYDQTIGWNDNIKGVVSTKIGRKTYVPAKGEVITTIAKQGQKIQLFDETKVVKYALGFEDLYARPRHKLSLLFQYVAAKKAWTAPLKYAPRRRLMNFEKEIPFMINFPAFDQQLLIRGLKFGRPRKRVKNMGHFFLSNLSNETLGTRKIELMESYYNVYPSWRIKNKFNYMYIPYNVWDYSIEPMMRLKRQRIESLKQLDWSTHFNNPFYLYPAQIGVENSIVRQRIGDHFISSTLPTLIEISTWDSGLIRLFIRVEQNILPIISIFGNLLTMLLNYFQKMNVMGVAQFFFMEPDIYFNILFNSIF